MSSSLFRTNWKKNMLLALELLWTFGFVHSFDRSNHFTKFYTWSSIRIILYQCTWNMFLGTKICVLKSDKLDIWPKLWTNPNEYFLDSVFHACWFNSSGSTVDIHERRNIQTTILFMFSISNICGYISIKYHRCRQKIFQFPSEGKPIFNSPWADIVSIILKVKRGITVPNCQLGMRGRYNKRIIL